MTYQEARLFTSSRITLPPKPGTRVRKLNMTTNVYTQRGAFTLQEDGLEECSQIKSGMFLKGLQEYIDVCEAKEVCQDDAKWRLAVSAYPNGNLMLYRFF